jgi:hypothetical protein
MGKSGEEQESFSKGKQATESFRKGESPFSKDSGQSNSSKPKKSHGGSKDIGGMQFGPIGTGLGNFKIGGNKAGS